MLSSGSLEITQENDRYQNIKDDPSIPYQVDYYYGKIEMILIPFLILLFLFFGIYVIHSGENKNTSFLHFGLAAYILITERKKIKEFGKWKAQLSINEEGIDIKFKNLGFVSWEDTDEIEVDAEREILILGIEKGEDFKYLTIPLKDLYIKDYDEFNRIINVYLKRKNLL